jgi:hypothetical protein
MRNGLDQLAMYEASSSPAWQASAMRLGADPDANAAHAAIRLEERSE